ncbi:MAG: hypothetical protein ABIJ21_06055 [Nanoarchaeota archaeon]
MKEKVSLILDKETWQEFKKHCHDHGFNFSRKIEILIRNELNQKPRKEKRTQEIMEMLAELISEKSVDKRESEKGVEGKESPRPTDLKSLQERYLEKRRMKK